MHTHSDRSGTGRLTVAARCAGAHRALLTLVVAGLAAGGARAQLFPGALVGAGETPASPVVADFNGDGADDLAVANRGSGDVSIALGRGNGGFAPQRRVAVSPAPFAMAAGDFDDDGHLDLAVADGLGGGVSMLRGRGDGTFAAPRSVVGPVAAVAIVAADFDRDGRADLAVADAVSPQVVLLLGQGDGTFATGTSIDPATQPLALAAADLDHDGRPDLVVAGRFRVAVLKGRGDGRFDRVFVGATATSSVSLTVADLNGDAVPDVALGGRGNGCDEPFLPGVAVLLGNGDGTLTAGPTLDTATSESAVAAADFDGDGRTDLVLSRVECGADGRGTVSVYRGRGDGTFEAPRRTDAGYSPSGLAIGRFNRDRVPDVAVTGGDANYVSVLLGAGDGRLAPRAAGPARLEAGDAPTAIVSGDFNGDGRPDLATADDWSHDVTVLLAAGHGRFRAPSRYAVGHYPQSLLAVDLDDDGHLDLVADDRILMGRGDGSFTAGPALPAGYRALAVACGDLNGDGRRDLAIADAGDFGGITGAVTLFLNAGGGTFLPAGRLEAGDAPVAVVVADFDRDGRADLAAADAWTTELHLFHGAGDGTFVAAPTVDAGLWARVLIAADMDGDRVVDLVAGGFNIPGGGGTVALLRGRGDGTFAPAATQVAGPSALGLAAGDVDADGDLDLVAAAYDADAVSVLLNRGNGSFAPQAVYFAGDAPGAVVIADLDGDSRSDLAVANYAIPGTVSLLLNRGPFPPRGPHATRPGPAGQGRLPGARPAAPESTSPRRPS